MLLFKKWVVLSFLLEGDFPGELPHLLQLLQDVPAVRGPGEHLETLAIRGILVIRGLVEVAGTKPGLHLREEIQGPKGLAYEVLLALRLAREPLVALIRWDVQTSQGAVIFKELFCHFVPCLSPRQAGRPQQRPSCRVGRDS